MQHLQQLQQNIQNSIKSSKIRGIKKLNEVDIDVITGNLIVMINDSSINYIPFTATACHIGDRVCKKLEVTKVQRFKFGAFLIECLADMNIVKLVKSQKEQYFVEVTDILIFSELLLATYKFMKELAPDLSILPQFEEPKQWRNFYNPVSGPIIRGLNSSQKQYFTYENCPEVFKTINKVQSIQWKVNKKLLKTYNLLQKDSFFTYSNTNLDEQQRESNISADKNVLLLAEEVGSRIFYNYHFYDSRGRLYCNTNYLNYQGSKLAKSLCYYADKKPLGRSGYTFLLSQASTMFGEDKLNMDAKINFAEEHLDEWMVWAENPVKYKDWMNTDDPHNFLACINEIYEALKLDDPYKYESGLPIALDASCSGLMILSALSRDSKSGELCNLTKTDDRGDYYLHIADHCSVFENDEFWSKHKDKRRKIVKRQAMIFFYSAKAKCMQDTIWDDWRSELPGITKFDCVKLGNQVYQACRNLMPGPAHLMDMFIDKGVEAFNEDKHYTLDLPNGFRLHQNYTIDRAKVIKIRFQDKVVQSRVIIERGHKLNNKRIKSATSPNVVHSIDAQLVAKAITENDYQTTTIHDSFSTHAADAGKLFEDLRTQFVDFFNNLVLPGYEFPTGKLDLNNVIYNEFCYA